MYPPRIALGGILGQSIGIGYSDKENIMDNSTIEFTIESSEDGKACRICKVLFGYDDLENIDYLLNIITYSHRKYMVNGYLTLIFPEQEQIVLELISEKLSTTLVAKHLQLKIDNHVTI